MQENMELRTAAKTAGVKLWEVAEAIGISDGMFSRKLRRELPEAERKKLLNVIQHIAKQKGGHNNA